MTSFCEISLGGSIKEVWVGPSRYCRGAFVVIFMQVVWVGSSKVVLGGPLRHFRGAIFFTRGSCMAGLLAVE